MESTNWLKQTLDKALFPDLLWARPQNKRQAGKLLIIGGNQHGFSATVTSYNASLKAGAGSVRVLLPQSLQKTLGTNFSEAEFLPSTPSGSFSSRAIDGVIENSKWSDGVLLAGDFGRNSETAIFLSSFIDKFSGQITVAQDALDYFLVSHSPLLQERKILSIINLGKLQKLAKNNRPNNAIRHSMSLLELVNILADWKSNVITRHAGNFIATSNGKVSTTLSEKEQDWQVELAAYAAVWWLQNPEKSLESFTTALFDYLQA